ncbi:exocyst complex component 3-like protein 4 isoform X2 [Xenopus laevis]|uniref:Exocyst complex component 3-like protein 4 isoform X2 n=1 Tax=Xenopus laevis TaxID=8355 RepID=A0A8J1LJY7_XENLA|nr:exocyst complex component 3-like protein 4 isoform X2 [Xenopus laevis]
MSEIVNQSKRQAMEIHNLPTSKGGSPDQSDDGSLQQSDQWETPNNKGIQKKSSFLETVGSMRKSIRRSRGQSARDDSSPEKKETANGSKSISFKKKINFRKTKKSDNENEIPEESTENVITRREILSVMEIHDLIKGSNLKDAFDSTRAMEENLLEDYNSSNNNEKNRLDITRRAKDINILYKKLFTEIQSIVKRSLHEEDIDEQILASAIYIIKEEDEGDLTNQQATGENPDIPQIGQRRQWKQLWKDTIKESVTERIGALPVNEADNSPWLANHLESLKTQTVLDLIKVKSFLKPLYPEDYDVCGIYIRYFHNALSCHLQKTVVPKCKECSQLYSLLNWVLNTYTSEDFMANPELQPEVNNANLHCLLESDCLHELKDKYNKELKNTIKLYMTNILKLETDKWQKEMETDEEILKSNCLPIYIDIEEMTGRHVRESAKLSEDLETLAFHACMTELGSLALNLQDAFTQHHTTKRSEVRITELFLQNLVIYINSFIKLRQSTMQSDAEPCKEAEDRLTKAINNLTKLFFSLFSKENQPHFQKLLTKKWIKNDTAFNAIMKSAENLHESLIYLAQPSHKGSDQDWLFPAVQYISDIIGLRKKEDISKKIEMLFKTYPDFGEEHVSAILYLQGMRRSKNLSVQHFFKELQAKEPQKAPHMLFAEIDCPTQTFCMPLMI